MTQRINWKKGMRLTDEVLIASDNCTAQAVKQSLMLASAGRFGLLPSMRPFQLSLNISAEQVEVTTLDMLALTQAGEVVDLTIGNGFSDSPETRFPIPKDGNELFLTVNVQPEAWTEDHEGFLKPEYFFALITPQTALSAHAVPIGHLLKENGWQEDTHRFVPPCLYLSAHHYFDQQRIQMLDILKSIQEKTKLQAQSPVKTAISIYWPIVQQVFIRLNTEHETMTPAMLQACVQKVVGGFALACEMDEVLTLEDSNMFFNFSQVPYNYQNNYLRIKQGIGMCRAIDEKIDKFSLLNAAPVPPPPQPAPEPKPDPRRSWLGKKI